MALSRGLYIALCMTALLSLLLLVSAQERKRKDKKQKCSYDCDRVCDGEARTCCFDWSLEDYTVLSAACQNCSRENREGCYAQQCVVADGYRKPIAVANRQVPGPSIVVCRGDTIRVTTRNLMHAQSTSLHWHGIRQVGTPWMDGVAGVTQCAIGSGETFVYQFKAREAGTFFWHSHQGSHKLDGLQGALIIRDAQDPQKELYDEDLTEHIIWIEDWSRLFSVYFTPGQHDPDFAQVPDAVLISGFGPISRFGVNTDVPVPSFKVRQGVRYRFRMIGATCMTCAFALTIEGHNLTVISADGGLNFRPVVVNSIGFSTAERFDFVFSTERPVGSRIRMQVKTLSDFCNGINQYAEIVVVGAEDELSSPSQPEDAESFLKSPLLEVGRLMNPPNGTCTKDEEVCLHMVRGMKSAPKAKTAKHHVQLIAAWAAHPHSFDELFRTNTYYVYEEPLYGEYTSYKLNRIRYMNPPSPLLTQYKDIPQSSFCPRDCYQWANNFTRMYEEEDLGPNCRCTSIYKVPYGAVVDLIIVDTGERDGFDHVFHLHGHNFHILEVGVLPEKRSERGPFIKERMKSLAEDDVELDGKALRDSQSTPGRGYVLARFTADNRGFWLLHCHFLFHLENGMASVIQVGRREKMPRPPAGFPKCGNFDPNSS